MLNRNNSYKNIMEEYSSEKKSQKEKYHRMKLSNMFSMDKYQISIPDFDSVYRSSHLISFKSKNVNSEKCLSFYYFL